MVTIPTADEVGSGEFFLKAINSPAALLAVRLVAVAIVIIFLGSYLYIKIRKKEEKA